MIGVIGVLNRIISFKIVWKYIVEELKCKLDRVEGLESIIFKSLDFGDLGSFEKGKILKSFF